MSPRRARAPSRQVVTSTPTNQSGGGLGMPEISRHGLEMGVLRTDAFSIEVGMPLCSAASPSGRTERMW